METTSKEEMINDINDFHFETKHDKHTNKQINIQRKKENSRV